MTLNHVGLILVAGLILGVTQVKAEDQELSISSVILSMRPETQVTSGRIYLSDVVDCRGDALHCREASGIDVAGSPHAGRMMILSQNHVKAIIQKEWPHLSVMIDGSDTTKVQAVAADVKQDDVKSKLQSWINDQLDAALQIRVIVSKVVIPFGSGVRPSHSAVDFPDLQGLPLNQIEWLSKNLSGVRLTQFKFFNPNDPDDSQIANGQAFFILQKLLPVANEPLVPGSIVSESQITDEWVSVRRGAYDYIENSQKIVGKKVRTPLSRGEAFTIRHIDTAKVVDRNQLVNLVIRNGNVEVASRATTMDAGAKGQIVDVVNVANKKRMRAKVIDERTVEAVAF